MRITAQYLLGQLVAYAGLIGATVEYIEIIKRRVTSRRRALELFASQEAALRGMVRVLLAEK